MRKPHMYMCAVYMCPYILHKYWNICVYPSQCASASCLQDKFIVLWELKRTSSKMKKLKVEAGFYSEADMKKPVSESGLGWDASLVLHYEPRVSYVGTVVCACSRGAFGCAKACRDRAKHTLDVLYCFQMYSLLSLFKPFHDQAVPTHLRTVL